MVNPQRDLHQDTYHHNSTAAEASAGGAIHPSSFSYNKFDGNTFSFSKYAAMEKEYLLKQQDTQTDDDVDECNRGGDNLC